MASNKYARAAEKDHAKAAAEKLRVSFEYLDLTLAHFFIHGLEPDHYRKAFDCINALADSTEDLIVQQTHPSLEPKSIFNTDRGTYKRFPEHLETRIASKISGTRKHVDPLDKAAVKADEEARAQAQAQAKKIVTRAFEVRVGKGYGRIHGIVWDKVFYVVWIDPAHNLYPNERFGIRMHKDYATVRGFGPEEIDSLKKTNQQIVDDYNQLRAEYDELMQAYADG